MIRIGSGVLLAAVLLPAVCPAAERVLPWKVGDTPVAGWVVGEIIQRHQEFARFSFKRGQSVVCVEVRYREKDDPDPSWCSRFYRIQPCPGREGNEPLLRSLLGWLRDWEQTPQHARSLKKILQDSKQASTPPLMAHSSAFYAVLNCLALLLFFGLLVNWLRMFPGDRTVVVSGAVLAAGAVAVVLCGWDSSQITAGWVTVLHEGYGYQNVQQLGGTGVHAKANFLFLQELWSGEGSYSSGSVVLRATLFVNICLAMVNTIAFFVVAYLASRKILVAVFFTGLMIGNISFINAVASETPAQLLLSYFLAGTLAAAHLNLRDRTGWVVASVAMLQLVLLGLLASASRQEMIVLAVPAVLCGVVQLFSLGPRLGEWLRAGWERARRHWRWVLPLTGAVAAASTLWWIYFECPGDPRIGWAIDGLFPFNPSFLTLPRFFIVYLPLGLTLLIVLGLVGTFRRPFKFFLLPLSLLVLWRVYYSASHGYGGPFYERFRFLTLLTPWFIFLAVFSLGELRRWWERIPGTWVRNRLLPVLLGLTFFVWWPLGWGGYFRQGHNLPGVPRSRVLLSRNQQTEVRYMLDLMDRYPDCVFVTRTMKYGDDRELTYYWGLFGKAVRMDLFPQKAGETLEEVVAGHVPAEACVLFYHGLDCNKVSGDHCRAQTSSKAVVEESILENLQYTFDHHGVGTHGPVVRLGVFSIRAGSSGGPKPP